MLHEIDPCSWLRQVKKLATNHKSFLSLRNNRFQIDQKFSIYKYLLCLRHPVHRSENKSYWNYTVETVKMQRGCVIYSPGAFSGNTENIKMQKLRMPSLKSSDGEYFSLKRDACCFRDKRMVHKELPQKVDIERHSCCLHTFHISSSSFDSSIGTPSFRSFPDAAAIDRNSVFDNARRVCLAESNDVSRDMS